MNTSTDMLNSKWKVQECKICGAKKVKSILGLFYCPEVHYNNKGDITQPKSGERSW